MAFTYSGNPGDSRHDWLRFVLGDTNAAKPILTDAEIDYLVGEYPAKKALLAAAFRQCANHFAASLVKRSLGPQSEDATKRHQYYADMANKYEKESNFMGVPPLPPYASEKVFSKNMMGNDE